MLDLVKEMGGQDGMRGMKGGGCGNGKTGDEENR
jgi:hypothetical protein